MAATRVAGNTIISTFMIYIVFFAERQSSPTAAGTGRWRRNQRPKKVRAGTRTGERRFVCSDLFGALVHVNLCDRSVIAGQATASFYSSPPRRSEALPDVFPTEARSRDIGVGTGLSSPDMSRAQSHHGQWSNPPEDPNPPLRLWWRRESPSLPRKQENTSSTLRLKLCAIS